MNAKPLHIYFKRHGAEMLPADLQQYADHFNVIQHRILTRRWQKQTDDSGQYTPLKWDYLAAELTPQATGRLLQWAKSERHIISDNRWIEGEKAIGYRLSEEMENLPTKRERIIDEQLSTRIKAIEKRDSRHYTKAHRHLRKWLYETSISCRALDTALAISETEASRESNVWSIRMLMNGDFTFSRCDYGRCHTNITRLHRPLRRYLRIHGKQLINLDIANSQPLFLGITMQDRADSASLGVGASSSLHFARQARLLRSANAVIAGFKLETGSPCPNPNPSDFPPIRPQNDHFQSHNPHDSQAVTSEFKKPQTAFDTDLKNYLQTCQTGTLYSTLMDSMKWGGTKDEFKRDCWFQFLYGSNKRLDQLDTPERQNLKRLNEVFAEPYTCGISKKAVKK